MNNYHNKKYKVMIRNTENIKVNKKIKGLRKYITKQHHNFRKKIQKYLK